jgi:hypothetical protein
MKPTSALPMIAHHDPGSDDEHLRSSELPCNESATVTGERFRVTPDPRVTSVRLIGDLS